MKIRIYTFVFLLLASFASKADYDIKLYVEEAEQGYRVYADNNEVCPISISIDFKLVNLEVEGGKEQTFLVQPGKQKELLTSMKVVKKGKAYKFSYEYWACYGDVNQNNYDEDYAYFLPFSKSESYRVDQGYNGSFSHKNENALDFTMPVGTEIRAIRDGIVVAVVDKNNKHCASRSCRAYNNYVIIYHPDGTLAEYTHIKRKGSEVKVGDKVEKGQLIAYSGNVGWSTGPHLHLVVFLQKMETRESLKTKFMTGTGENLEFLEEDMEYARHY